MGVWQRLLNVIMPVYNVENYLRQCLDSVINQTLRDIEIICIDDQPHRRFPWQFLKDYAAIDPRIRIITQKMPVQVLREILLKVAKGEYLSFWILMIFLNWTG